MATTVDGLQITFNPISVVAIADHDAAMGEAVTWVYGVTRGMLKISESTQAFMARLRIKAKFEKT